ncbi:phytanoyl-CoA dioxygenase family protein [Nocardia sp. NPDC060249]|uniref:phytanoyl-CoA dioxygenase family protein n=1 Tax=Nocardia sp. NPDC060249 TaxID=3347082 RepID=UPI003651189C
MPVNAQLIVKGPHERDALAWHFDPDPPGRPRPRYDYVIAIYLEDSTAGNGAVQIMPGSHRWSINRRIDWLHRHQHTACGDPIDGAVEIVCPSGTICLHERGILHGSPPNSTAAQRRTIYLHYRSTEFLCATRGAGYVDKLSASLALLPTLDVVH